MVKWFYYDTILYDDVALEYLVSKVGKDRLVAGSDYPFTIKTGPPGGVLPSRRWASRVKRYE